MTCKNDKNYAHPSKTVLTCNRIRWIPNEDREKLCKDTDVREHCPQTCGVCCENDPDYTFITGFGEVSCEWISENVNRTKWCNRTPQDISIVRDACPVACSFCFTEVLLLPSNTPSSSPTSSSTPLSTSPQSSIQTFASTRPSFRPTLSLDIVAASPTSAGITVGTSIDNTRGTNFFIIPGGVLALCAIYALCQILKRASIARVADNLAEYKISEHTTSDKEEGRVNIKKKESS